MSDVVFKGFHFPNLATLAAEPDPMTETLRMNCLGIFFLVALAHFASGDGGADNAKQANEAVYHTANQPYSYRPYGVDRYDDDAYKSYDDTETFGAYPWTADFGAQRLHLSGGIYRPYGYDDYYGDVSGYQRNYAHDNAYKYYDNSAARYVKQPYVYNRRY